MTTFRSISHMIVGAVASLGILTSAQAQDFAFEASGQFTPTCSTGFSGRPAAEGMSFHFETTLSLDLLLGEPVVRSSLAWRPVGFGATCIQPYGQDELVRLGSVDQYDSEGLAHPIDVDLVAELIVPSAPNGRVFLPFNPGALSKTAGEPGYNTAGSTNWDGLFFTLPGLGSDFWDTEKYAFLSAEAAKDIFTAGFDVAQVHVAQSEFDLTELKSSYGAQVNTASALVKVANRLADWGQETFVDYPPEVQARIVEDVSQKVPDNIAALRGTIDDIQVLHEQLQQRSNDAAITAEIAQQGKGLEAFLNALDAPNENEEFWRLLTHSSATSGQAEKDRIAARMAESLPQEVETSDADQSESSQQDQKPLHLNQIVYKLTYALEHIAVGSYDTDCGKANFRIPDVDGDATTGVLTLNVLKRMPMCGNGSDIKRNSIFEFSVLDIVSYELTNKTLVINFAGETLSENYYTTASYPDRFQDSLSQLSLLINPEEDYSLGEAEKSLRSIISGR